MTLTEELRQFARNLGADLVGITPASRLDAALTAPNRAVDLLPEVKSVVLGLHIPDAILEVCMRDKRRPFLSFPVMVAL